MSIKNAIIRALGGVPADVHEKKLREAEEKETKNIIGVLKALAETDELRSMQSEYISELEGHLKQ